jgi:hypothetical protein
MTDAAKPKDLLWPLIDGPSAWIGATLRHQPEAWIHHLSADEIAEIEHAAADVRKHRIDVAAINRDNFRLPRFGSTLDAVRRDVLDGRGFVVIRGLPVKGKQMVDNAAAYCGIGSYFGSMRSQNAKGHLISHVRDAGVKAATNSHVRAYQSNEQQMFHTDRCDIVGLLCLHQAKSGGLSSVVSAMSLYNTMAGRRPDLARRLFAPLPFDRRGEVPEGEDPFYTMPVFVGHAGLLSVNYSRRNIDSSQRHPAAPRLTPADLEALDMFDTLANDPELRLDMMLEAGDIQLLHNHTMLHDRTAFEDWPEPERKRHLLRLWLAAPHARALHPIFTACLGSVTIGDRGGIICKDTRLHVPLEPA